jgi:hypothetical protein
MILTALSEGMGVNAATRVFSVGKNSIYRWLNRLSSLQQTLMLYSLCHQFIQLTVEGDELTTKKVPAVMSGVIEEGLTLEDVLRLKGVNN